MSGSTGGETRRAVQGIDAAAIRPAEPVGGFMGERRLVHDLNRNHAATGPAGDEELRRLVANRDRLAALMRAAPRVASQGATRAYRSSYAALLWALAEAAEPEPEPAGRASAHLTLIDPDDGL